MSEESVQKRFLVLRVPSSGPRALIAAPNDFATEAEARQRIAEIEMDHKIQHHTHLEIVAYAGDKYRALAEEGVIF